MVMAGYKSEIQQACGDQEYETLKENLYNGIEQAKRLNYVHTCLI